MHTWYIFCMDITDTFEATLTQIWLPATIIGLFQQLVVDFFVYGTLHNKFRPYLILQCNLLLTDLHSAYVQSYSYIHVLLNSKVEIHNYWKICLHVEYNIRLFNAIFPKARSPRIYLYFARKQVQWFITTSSNINGNPICKEYNSVQHSTILTSLKISVWYDRCYYSAQHELSFLSFL